MVQLIVRKISGLRDPRTGEMNHREVDQEGQGTPTPKTRVLNPTELFWTNGWLGQVLLKG